MEINVLPPDIILCIFEFLSCHQLEIIAKVCSYWENLVYSSPCLWSNVSVRYDIYNFVKLFDTVKNHIRCLDILCEDLLKISQEQRGFTFENLQELTISGKFYERIFDFFTRCPRLNYLRLNVSRLDPLLTGLSIAQLKGLSITMWHVSRRFGDTLLSCVAKHPHLTALSISTLNEDTGHSQYDDIVEKILTICPNLTSLKWYGNLISGVAFTKSTETLNFTEFAFRSTHFVRGGLLSVLNRTECLQSIDVRYCGSSITDEELCTIGKKCPHLKYFSFGDNSWRDHCAKDDGSEYYYDYFYNPFDEIFKENTYLGLVYDDFCSDAGIQEIAKGCPKLKCVRAFSSRNFNETAISDLSISCKYLQCLRLDWCIHLTDFCLFQIGENCSNLSEAHFSNNSFFTILGPIWLLLSCKKLNILHFDECSDISDLPTDKIMKSEKLYKNEILEKYRRITESATDIRNFPNHSHITFLSVKCYANNKITYNTALTLARLCPDLRKFDIDINFTGGNDTKMYYIKLFRLCTFLRERLCHQKLSEKERLSILRETFN